MTVHCQRCDCPYANFVLVPISSFESAWMWLCEECLDCEDHNLAKEDENEHA